MANVNGYTTDLPADFTGTIEFSAGFSPSFAGYEAAVTPTAGSTIQFGAGNAPSFPAYFSQLDADQTPQPVTLLNMNPSAGSSLLAEQPITFELQVTPPAILGPALNGRVIIWVMYPELGGQTEVVYDGENFTAAFDGSGKTEDTIVMSEFIKRKYTVLRNGGWPARPKLYIHANTDRGGLN